ncbi:MAG: cation diffusion facilitator family transporter [Candidatus Rariloculaceae bacterium]
MATTDQGSAAKAILYAFLANFGIALAKTWGAIITGSGSMLAEAIHSYADSGNQVLLYFGMRRARRPADPEHPLGYGKLTYFWSFIVALLLFSVGGLFSIYEGLHKLAEPEPLNAAWIGLSILAGAIVLEGLSLLGCLREIGKIRGSKTLGYWLKHTRNAELVVILGEDLAAMLGLTIAFAFLGLSVLTGDPFFDAIGSMAIGVVLVTVSAFIASRIRSLLVGRSAEPELVELIDSIIDADPAIVKLLNTITLQFGPDVMLAAKIHCRPDLSMGEAVDAINALEQRIKEQAPAVRWCFIEPDVTD